MQFLWRSQLKKERGKFLLKNNQAKKVESRAERLGNSSRRSSWPIVLVVFLWLATLATFGYIVFFSPYLALESPSVEGLRHIDETAFRAVVSDVTGQKYFGLIDSNRFFLLRSGTVASTLQKYFPLISTLVIKCQFPHQWHIFVTERDTLLIWQTGEKRYQLREDGSIIPAGAVFDEPINKAQSLTLIDESGQDLPTDSVLDSEFITLPEHLRMALSEQMNIETLPEIKFSSQFAHELKVTTAEGYQIYFSTTQSVDDSLQALRLLLEQVLSNTESRHRLEYIDLRTEKKAFYHFREDE